MTLPPLPPPAHSYYAAPMFTDEQMREYGAACAAQEREACAAEADHWQAISTTPGHACGQYIAAAIRARGKP